MLLQPGHNVWRLARADRAAVLIDGAAYFRAAREAMLKARRTIFVVGWDMHSKMRLVGETGKPSDGHSALLKDFLCELVKERPELIIRLLLWDYSILYAAEREIFPVVTLRWNTPPQIRFCLDNAVPVGSSQHQKVVVIDDAVAFSGGLDVTVRRWDTPEHALDNRRRIDPDGRPYPPFHDVQAIVDGEAARSLAQLARARWECACGEKVPLLSDPNEDAWPASVRPDFTRVEVGIARTQPAYGTQAEVREVEKLFLDSIDAAQSRIYIENQFLTCAHLAERLARRLKERPKLELLLVAPQSQHSWLEARTMRNGRIRFMQLLRQPDIAARVRLMYPEVRRGRRKDATMVHSKVMVIDDSFLRVGSANLNNRSMGADTECDLIIEARTEEERMQIAGMRNRLIGDHCGVSEGAVASAIERSGSLLRAAETLCGRGHRLRPIEDGKADGNEFSAYIESIADPERPIAADAFVRELTGRGGGPRPISALAKVGAVALLLLALTLAWQFTPLAEWASPEAVRDTLAAFAQGPSAPFAVIGAFLAGGLVAFPVTILVAATAAAFGPAFGFAYAVAGVLSSALLTYLIGAKIGRDTLRNILGPRLSRVRSRIAQEGIFAVASVRLVPIAPFTVVNLVAGASEIRLADYMLGTLIGMAPGLVVLSVLGHQIMEIIVAPSLFAVTVLVLAIAGWVALSFLVQRLVSKQRGD